MLIECTCVDESARILDVPAVALTDCLQGGITRTHDVSTSVGVPTTEAVYGNDSHELYGYSVVAMFRLFVTELTVVS